MMFNKECEVCGGTYWCVLQNDHWICLGCIEERFIDEVKE